MRCSGNVPIEALYISHTGADTDAGWSMPPKLSKFIEGLVSDGTVLHLFGGLAKFGTRLDIDPVTVPHVIGDAWLPPFKRDSFDYVVIDPPYDGISTRWFCELMVRASLIARRAVLWYSTKWFPNLKPSTLTRAWLICLGGFYHVRCLQWFAVGSPKREPNPFFQEGPAVKYNWPLAGQTRFRW